MLFRSPLLGAQRASIKEGRKTVWSPSGYIPGAEGITAARPEADAITFTVQSGTYVFKVKK